MVLGSFLVACVALLVSAFALKVSVGAAEVAAEEKPKPEPQAPPAPRYIGGKP